MSKNTKSELSNYAICYGFMEGAGNARRLRKLMRQKGFKQSDAVTADIIIAHSTGCVLIPASAKPKLVIYTGMPLVLARPQRTWVRATMPRFSNGVWRELANRANNTYYMFRHAGRNLVIMRDPKIAKPVIFPKAQTVFIANRNDPWPKGQELSRLVTKEPWAFIALLGEHDDLYQDPEKYVTIINYYAGLLAQANE